MTNFVVSLTNVKTYDDNHQIQTVNGISLPIGVNGDIFLSLSNVFVSLSLSTNLIFVNQLVNHGYNGHFSCFGYVVQDQVLGKIILKRPKLRRLFPLCLSPSS